MKQTKKIILKLLLLFIIIFSSFSFVCQGEEMPARKFMVTAGGNLFSSSSADFKQIYGQAVFMPDIKITHLVYGNISVWGECGWFSKQGLIEDVNEATHIRQTMLGFGVGYVYKPGALWQLRGELGMTFISFKEEGLETTMKGSGTGWKIGADLDFFIWKNVFASLAGSFSQAGDVVQTGKVKLGGFQLGLGLGFSF